MEQGKQKIIAIAGGLGIAATKAALQSALINSTGEEIIVVDGPIEEPKRLVLPFYNKMEGLEPLPVVYCDACEPKNYINGGKRLPRNKRKKK